MLQFDVALTSDQGGPFDLGFSHEVGQSLAPAVLPVAITDNSPAGVTSDLVVADATDGTVTVVTQNGSGDFAVADTFDVGAQPSGVAADDLNGDGVVDIVVAAEGDDAVTVLLSNP